VTAAAQHHVIRRVIVRRIMVAVMQLQRPGPTAAGAAATLRGRQACAAFLVAASTDAARVGGARLARRAVGTGVDQAPAADATPLHGMSPADRIRTCQ
jgi:hypothetical protein